MTLGHDPAGRPDKVCRYRVKEFRPGLWHVIDSDGMPIYDGARDGRDKPVVFRDPDAADLNGSTWHGVNIGDNDVCRVKRCKS